MTKDAQASVHAVVDEMLEDGMKVLALACKPMSRGELSREEEEDFTLLGYLAFFDAPKKSAAAAEEMLSICDFAECGGKAQPLTEEMRGNIRRTVEELNEKGFRVLVLAQKSGLSPEKPFGVEDERGMVLLGYLAFLDPPKESAADAIRALKNHGVVTKILTGDNDKVARTVCKQVGLKVRNMLLGSDLDQMSDTQLAQSAGIHRCVRKTHPRSEGKGGFGAEAEGPHRWVYGGWDQRRSRHEGRRYRHLGGYRSGCGKGIGRYHPAGKKT